jgi:molybdenum cofactor cytidylyltransferase
VIGALILAAGQSVRMGRPKLALPWQDTTVIGQVARSLAQAGVEDILAVTGGSREIVEEALRGSPARTIYNPGYSEGEMTSSMKVGLAAMQPETTAALVALGDQPQIQAEIVRQVLTAYRQSGAVLVAPSYQMRRGHPWLVARPLWQALLDLGESETLRDFLTRHASSILYVNVDSPSILKDLDTPADYEREKPAGC